MPGDGPAVFLAAGQDDPALRHILIGKASGRGAGLAGYRAIWSPDHPATPLAPATGAVLHGRLYRPGPDDLARVQYHAGVQGLIPAQVTVDIAGHPVAATAFVAAADRPGSPHLADFDAAAWGARWAAIQAETAVDVMADHGRRDAALLARRYGQMLVRGASRVRARFSAPVALRRQAGPGDVVVEGRRTAYAAFFAVEDYDLSWRQFGGGMSAPAARAVFVSGDAVTVLPYDPATDLVLLIEQFRPGPMARGDAQPWLIEPVAGRIDPGETPELAARREAGEEAGLTLGALLPVASYYPTPGAKTEFLYSFVALADLSGITSGVYGLATEAEDIRTHVIPFPSLMALIESGEAANAPLILTALWLDRARPRLRCGAPGS